MGQLRKYSEAAFVNNEDFELHSAKIKNICIQKRT